MGCDLKFSLISASKYVKYLRPKLIEYYGGINLERAVIGEKRRLQTANLIKGLQSGSLEDFLRRPKTPSDGPLKKYLVNGRFKSDKLYEKIQKSFSDYTQQIYETRNHFLRLQEYLQQIDSFQKDGYYLKVSNTLQIENYCTYLGAVKKVFQDHPKCEWESQYHGIDEAIQIYNDAYKQMKEEKKDTFLISQASN